MPLFSDHRIPFSTIQDQKSILNLSFKPQSTKTKKQTNHFNNISDEKEENSYIATDIPRKFLICFQNSFIWDQNSRKIKIQEVRKGRDHAENREIEKGNGNHPWKMRLWRASKGNRTERMIERSTARWKECRGFWNSSSSRKGFSYGFFLLSLSVNAFGDFPISPQVLECQIISGLSFWEFLFSIFFSCFFSSPVRSLSILLRRKCLCWCVEGECVSVYVCFYFARAREMGIVVGKIATTFVKCVAGWRRMGLISDPIIIWDPDPQSPRGTLRWGRILMIGQLKMDIISDG